MIKIIKIPLYSLGISGYIFWFLICINEMDFKTDSVVKRTIDTDSMPEASFGRQHGKWR